MDLLDEEGRLLGVVNVVDALVVLVAVGLLAGGAVVVLDDTDPESPDEPTDGTAPQRYATLAYDVPLDNPAAWLSVSDELGTANETVTDVHRSTTVDGNAHVTARVAYRGTLGGTQDVLVGDSIEFTTRDTRVEASVRAVDPEDETLSTNRRSVVLRVDDANGGVTAMGPGDEVRVGDESVATVDAVAQRSENETLLGLTVTARETPTGSSFGGTILRVGERLGVVTDRATARGQIVALDTSDASAVG